MKHPLKHFKRIVFVGLAVSILAGCGSGKRAVEMPYDPEDSDALRISPCACVEYTEFNNQFEGTV